MISSFVLKKDSDSFEHAGKKQKTAKVTQKDLVEKEKSYRTPIENDFWISLAVIRPQFMAH